MTTPNQIEGAPAPRDVLLAAIAAAPVLTSPGDREATASGGGGEALEPDNLEPREPRALGYDVDRMNAEYALVLQGSQAVIYKERGDAKLDEQRRFLKVEAFCTFHANKNTEIRGADGKIKPTTWARRWLADRDRRSFQGIEFYPNPDGAPSTPSYLNLWSGFVCEPKAKKNGYKTFRDHVLNNLAAGDERLFAWVFGFFAQMVQRPRERLGVALVMRGRMGSGKTITGEVIGSLFPRHYFLVDDPRYVTGQFNAHMASCLLLQADEAVWAGDKAAEGRLKGLVTAPIQQIEAKGVDPIRLTNYVRLIMTSNEDWVVPAGKDERRFCVLDVNPRCAQNSEYFGEMAAELDGGGREALLHDLLAFDLSTVDLRQIPRTDALREQKIRSFHPIDAWWYDRLMAGAPTHKLDGWRADIAKAALVDDYVAHSERMGQRRKASDTELAMKLRKIVPGLKDRMAYVEDGPDIGCRRAYWLLPSLEDCRSAFDEAMQQRNDWPIVAGERGNEGDKTVDFP